MSDQEEPVPPFGTREWAHHCLDRAINRQAEWVRSGNSDQSQAQAILSEYLGMVGLALHAVREGAAPTFYNETPQDLTAGAVDPMRAALMRSIEMLQPVWPQTPRSIAGGLRSLRGDELMQMLQRCWEGEKVPLFSPPIGQGQYKWTERRFQFLAALWAMHWATVRGLTAEEADHKVYRAFHPLIATGKNQDGRLAKGQIPKWRSRLGRIAEGRLNDPFVSRQRAQVGIECAERIDEFEAARRSANINPASMLDWEIVTAQRLHHCAFDTGATGAKTLEEAGSLYQAMRDRRQI